LAPGPTSAQQVTNLSLVEGGPSNGAWRLFIQDDLVNNTGSIGGWTLTIDITPPVPTTPPTITPIVIPTTPVTPVKCPKGKRLKNGKCVKKKKKKKK